MRRARYGVVASVLSDRGCVRVANEDYGMHLSPCDAALLASKGTLTVVADGLGEFNSGAVASRMACEVVSHIYYHNGNVSGQALPIAVREANRRIYAASRKGMRLRLMGATCTALALRDGAAFLAHVGHSRLYLVRGGTIHQLTEDHSVPAEMVRHGIIRPEEVRRHPQRKVLLRALGVAHEVEVAAWEKPLRVQAGDRFILCSDGLYDLVEDEEIGQLVVSAPEPHAACEDLVALAKGRGGNDNITVAVVSVR